MSSILTHWPHFPPELGGVINRRTEELLGVSDAVRDDEGLITCLVLPLRDTVLYPNMLTPLFVIHEPSLQAVERAIRSGETMMAIALKEPDIEDPRPEHFYHVGSEAGVGRLMHLPDGSISIMAQGRRRAEIVEFLQDDGFLRVRARPIDEVVQETTEAIALMRAVRTLFE